MKPNRARDVYNPHHDQIPNHFLTGSFLFLPFCAAIPVLVLRTDFMSAFVHGWRLSRFPECLLLAVTPACIYSYQKQGNAMKV